MEVSWDKIKEQYMENINKEVANIYYRGLQAGEERARTAFAQDDSEERDKCIRIGMDRMMMCFVQLFSMDALTLRNTGLLNGYKDSDFGNAECDYRGRKLDRINHIIESYTPEEIWNALGRDKKPKAEDLFKEGDRVLFLDNGEELVGIIIGFDKKRENAYVRVYDSEDEIDKGDYYTMSVKINAIESR